MNTRAALHAHLATASAVTSKLATYGAAPAIFTARPVPQDAPRPYLALSLVAEPDADVINAPRRVQTFDATTALDYSGSMLAADALAEAVRAALHNTRLTIAGAHHVQTRCVGIAEAPTDATLTGHVLTFEIRARPGG